MSREVLDYQTPEPAQQRQVRSVVASAIRLVALSILFFSGSLMLIAASFLSRGQEGPIAIFGFLIVVCSGIAFASTYFSSRG